ncbi:TOPRIM nucleotidyl transferase/hydrolase domain-containing protein [Pseudomonas aeruginosa]
MKGKMYKRHARRGLAEAMLGPGVIVAEGITEHSALTTVAAKMEQADPDLFALDLAGITIFPVDGDGSLPNFGAFFKALGLRTYALAVAEAECNTVTGLKQVHHAATPLPLS